VELTPRYDGPDLLCWEVPVGDLAGALARQHARLAGVLAELDDEQWATPSRCEGWSVQDVVAHLVTANDFFALAIVSGRKGEPTRFLMGFDPVATPAQMVAAVGPHEPAETLARFVESNAGLDRALAGLEGDAWLDVAEAPPGHIPICAVAAHSLWDAWIHERDIALPLGLDVTVRSDEVAASLGYVATLSPLFAAVNGSTRAGTLVIDATDPDVRFVIELGATVTVHDGAIPSGAATISGDAVTLLEGLSFRRPLEVTVAEEHRWMLGGLAEAFDVASGEGESL
jgi:uncharacterized protein (TIGR03083 family)